MKLAVDAMGGDYAPTEIVAGALLAAREVAGEIILVGREPVLREELAQLGGSLPNVTIHHADEVVEMHESPRLALRQKAGSSVTVSVDLVRDGEADAAISAGNSGALMAAATMRLGTLPGVQRPAIAVLLPTALGRRVVLDAGANADCKPQQLVEFALMGSQYAEHALGVANPRVGLLSLGTEASKGNELTLAAYPLLEQAPVNFVGNVEGNQITAGDADVTVCDGFVGNAVLKVLEGTAYLLMTDLRAAVQLGWRARLGAWLLRRELREADRAYDYRDTGGALLLGANGVCIVAHGKSDRQAMAQAILLGARSVEAQVVERVRESFSRFAPSSNPATM